MHACGCVARTEEATGETPRLISTPGRTYRDANQLVGGRCLGKSPASGRRPIPIIAEADLGASDNVPITVDLPVKRANNSGVSRAVRGDSENDEKRKIAKDSIVGTTKPAVLGMRKEQRALADISNRQNIAVPPGPLPSKGSALHSEGTCKRCCFFPRGRCTNESNCEFCHYEHEKRTHRKRKSKTERGVEDFEIAVDDVESSAKESFPVTPENKNAVASKSRAPPPQSTIASMAMLCTVPVTTQQLTTAVPVFQVVAPCREERIRRTHHSAHPLVDSRTQRVKQGTSRIGDIRKDCQKPHEQIYATTSCLDRLTELREPRTNYVASQALVHLWHDAGDQRWQDYGHAWSPAYAQWDVTQCTEQVWDWMQPDEVHWNEFYVAEDMMPGAAPWSPPCADSAIPAYMLAIPNDSGVGATDDIENQPPRTLKILPPGVVVAVDYDPPPLAPATPQ
jgi:hypothetical protein